MIFFTLFFLASMSIVASMIKHPGVRRAARVFQVWYLLPLFVYQLLPFELPWDIDYLKVYLIIFFFMVSTILPFLFQRSSYDVENVSKTSSIATVGIYFGVLMLWLDFFYLRGISIRTITDNREIISSVRPALITYIWIFFSALSLYNLRNWQQGGILKNTKLLVPLLLYSIPLLISGNRQFVFFATIYLGYFCVISSKQTTLKIIGKITIFGVFVAILFFSVQFARQEFASNDQAAFIASINQVRCTNDALCEFSPNLSLITLYIFSYFGNIYHGLTLVLNNRLETPTFSLTATHLYSLLSNFFSFPGIPLVYEELQSNIQSLSGTFGGFWFSMFGSFYMDYGPVGLLILYLAVFLSFYSVIRIRNQDVSVKYFSFLFTILSFGIMYSPTSELFIFVLILQLVFIPGFSYLLKSVGFCRAQKAKSV